jgi:hypothetical protein
VPRCGVRPQVRGAHAAGAIPAGRSTGAARPDQAGGSLPPAERAPAPESAAPRLAHGTHARHPAEISCSLAGVATSGAGLCADSERCRSRGIIPLIGPSPRHEPDNQCGGGGRMSHDPRRRPDRHAPRRPLTASSKSGDGPHHGEGKGVILALLKPRSQVVWLMGTRRRTLCFTASLNQRMGGSGYPSEIPNRAGLFIPHESSKAGLPGVSVPAR